MGTATYFSPEQAEGKGVDARSDIYSLGVVLYEMAVGRPPFTGDSPVAVASKHVRDAPVLPREVNPAVPVALEAIVMMAMAKNPDDRYGSAEELRADLLRFADGRPVQAADPGVTSMMATVGATQAVPVANRTMAIPVDGGAQPPDSDELERKKRTRRLTLLLVVLLVALGVIAFFLLRSVGVFGGNVTIPNVVGDPQSAAVQTLKSDNLTVGTSSFRTSPQTKGIVLSTSPAAGTSVSKNSAVNLVVSDGPNIPIVTVPPVKGEQLTAAISAIQDAGLTYRVNDVTSTQPVGTVINQSPAGGVKVRATVPVVLTVSNAQSSVSVPSVLGQSPATAGATLRGDGLNVGSQSNACSSQYQSGSCRREPGPGHQRPAQHGRQPRDLDRQLRLGAQRRRSVGQLGQAAITGAGLVANQTTDATCAGGAHRATSTSRAPPRASPGQQRHHGDDLGLPVGDHHDHHPDHTVVDNRPRPARRPELARRSPAARALRARQGRPRAAAAELTEEVGQQRRARRGEDRLGVELHTLDGAACGGAGP